MAGSLSLGMFGPSCRRKEVNAAMEVSAAMGCAGHQTVFSKKTPVHTFDFGAVRRSFQILNGFKMFQANTVSVGA